MALKGWEIRRRTLWRSKCEDYFRDCDREGRKYTVSGLRLALDADEEKWERLVKDPVLRDIFDLALTRIRDSLEQREDQMAVLLLRRGECGGGAGGGEVRLRVTLGGWEDGADYGG